MNDDWQIQRIVRWSPMRDDQNLYEGRCLVVRCWRLDADAGLWRFHTIIDCAHHHDCGSNPRQSKRPSLKLLAEFDGLNWLLKRMSTVFNGLVKGVPVMAGAPLCVFIIACSIKASQRCQFQILDNNKTVTKPFDEVLVTVLLGSAVWGQRPSLYLHYSMSDLIVAIRLNLRRWDF